MKYKLLIIALAIVAAVVLGVKSSSASVPTLHSCYNQLGKPWTSVLDRASDAAYYGIFQYRGTAEQNTKLAKYMCPNDGMLGYSVATGYEKSLRATMTSVQATVPVTSLALKDGTTLDINVLGGKVFLSLEPGTAREEIVMCTNINTTSLNFESCTRGLAFSGTSTASVASLAKPHNAGSKVVMSNVHYVYEQYADVNNKDQTLAGNKNFSGNVGVNGSFTVTGTLLSTSPTAYLGSKLYLGDDTTALDKGLWAKNGDANYPFFRYNESLNTWQWSANGIDTYDIVNSGVTSLTASSTTGIGITDSKIYVNVSSTAGMSFDASGKLYQAIGNSLEYNGNAIRITTTTLSNAGIVTTTPTGGYIPLANASGTLNSWVDSWYGSGVDGDVTISASTTLTSDKYYNNLTINDNVVVNTGGYRIYVKNTLRGMGVSSTISRDGTSATKNVIGATLAYGSTGLSGDGGAGQCNATGNGKNSVAVANSYGGQGGRGGDTTPGGGGNPGGSSLITTTTIDSSIFGFFDLMDKYSPTSSKITGGAGGASGGVSLGVGMCSGAGGNGGGVNWVISKKIIGYLNLTAIGGNGGNASSSGVNLAGGSGGGGGGVILLGYDDISGASITTNVSGGNAGLEYNAQVGSNGSAGRVHYFKF